MLCALPRIAPDPDRNPDVENTGYWKTDDPPEPTPEQAARVASIPAWLRGLARTYGDAQGRTRERNSQLQRLISRPFSTRFG